MAQTTKHIRVDLIDPNPNQPRKRFPDEHIHALAASIQERGLLQPIKLRPRGKRFEIVAGECRWRAHVHLKRKTVMAIVEAISDEEMALQAIVENLQRRDMNPIEEANAYKSLVDRHGWDWDRIAKELGLGSAAQVRNRLKLLDLAAEIQHMVAMGSLPVATGYAIAMVKGDRLQTQMLRDYSSGKFKTTEQVRHAAIAIKEAQAQFDLGEFVTAPRASPKDVAAIRGIENKVAQVEALVSAGFHNGECVAAKRVDPDRVAKLADQLTLCRKHILHMEHALRGAAAQGTITLEMADA